MSASTPFALLANAGSLPWAEVPAWRVADFIEMCSTELGRGARLCSLFGVAEGEAVQLVAVLAFDADSTLAVGRSTPFVGGFPSLTASHPQAHLFEREVWEQHGLTPYGHPWLKPVRRSAGNAPASGEFFRVAGREIHEVAVGPVHAGIIEPGHFRFQCAGEEVLHLEIALGYQHRGIEEALCGGPYRTTLIQMETIAWLWDSASVRSRFDGVGKVSAAQAEDIGLVGPAARACGLVRDVRYDHPAGWYRFAQAPVTVWPGGDVFSRARVRALEIQRSGEFLAGQLNSPPAGDLRGDITEPQPNTLAVALVEGWRGEVCHVALTDSGGNFRRYKITDPSFHNWSGLALALRGTAISDFPICNKSFNLSYCGFDL